MLFVALAVIANHCQYAEFFSDPVLERRSAQASAAAPVSVAELTAWSNDGVAAVTDTVPEDPSVVIPFFSSGDHHELPKTLSRQVFKGFLFPLTAAGRGPAVF